MAINLKITVAKAILERLVAGKLTGTLDDVVGATKLSGDDARLYLSAVQGSNLFPITVKSDGSYEISAKDLPISRAQQLLEDYARLLTKTPQETEAEEKGSKEAAYRK